MNEKKYQGVIPALYACYDKEGNISPEMVREFTKYLISKGINGLYVGGSSGECIYQHLDERKLVLENVMEASKGSGITIIAHVACNNTADSRDLAAHAESLGVDAIASIPPIYFHLPPAGIAKYWNDISDAAPNTDFIIYNIPQLAGVSLTPALLGEMTKNPRVIAVKNSSMPVQDLQLWRDGGVMAFNGPDEQFVAGLSMGAVGGIGGTYAVMPELFVKLYALFNEGKMQEALALQDVICHIIYKMCSSSANMYAVAKEVLRLQGAPDIGGVRAPLTNLAHDDYAVAKETFDMINLGIKNL